MIKAQKSVFTPLIMVSLLLLMVMTLYIMCVQNLPMMSNSTIPAASYQGQQISNDINDVVYDTEIANVLSNVVIDPDYSHALEEHPNSAPLVHECMKNQGPYMQFQIRPKERYLRICIIDEDAGKIGFQIVDIVDRIAKERTAYVKDGFRTIRDVLDFAARRGYCRFKGPL